METRVLEYFLVVAKEKNITKSAQLLHITQPTLSRQLSQLEQDIGKQLFIRGKKGITLTDAGKMLERRAEDIIKLIDKTKQELNYQELEGVVSIGMADCKATNELLPKVIKECKENYPGITFDLFSGEVSIVKEKLNQGTLDIGLLLEPVDLEGFEYIRLDYKERWGIVTSITNDIANKEYITPKDLVNQTLFFNHKRMTLEDELKLWAGKYYDSYNIIGSYNLINSIASIVGDNVALALSIEGTFYTQNCNNIKFIPIKPEMTSSLVLVWKKNQTHIPTVKKIISLLKTVS